MDYAGDYTRVHVNFKVYDINCTERCFPNVYFIKSTLIYTEYAAYFWLGQLIIIRAELAEVCFSFARHMKDKAHDLNSHMATPTV